MSASEVFGLGERAVARRTDPETSHEAAESVKGISDLQQMVLEAFRIWGPMTDEWLERRLQPDVQMFSPSGLRSRRSELVAKGLLEWSGEFAETKAGRKARVWRVRKP